MLLGSERAIVFYVLKYVKKNRQVVRARRLIEFFNLARVSAAHGLHARLLIGFGALKPVGIPQENRRHAAIARAHIERLMGLLWKHGHRAGDYLAAPALPPGILH